MVELGREGKGERKTAVRDYSKSTCLTHATQIILSVIDGRTFPCKSSLRTMLLY